MAKKAKRPSPLDSTGNGSAVGDWVQAMINAKNPVFTGLENLTTENQKRVVRLAMQVRGTVDVGESNAGRGNMFALQKRGRVSATLGEVKSRSDLVVLWNPTEEMLEAMTPHIGDSANVVLVGPDVAHYDMDRVTVPESDGVAAIWWLRSLVSNTQTYEVDSFASQQPLVDLAESMKSASYGALIWDSSSFDPEFDLASEGLHCLLRELNQHTRFVGLPFRSGQSLSAENVTTWSTGFSFAVNLNREQPRSYWLEYSTEQVMQENEWDFLMQFEPGKITTESKELLGLRQEFLTTQQGVSESGTTSRWDDMPLEIEPKEKPDLLHIPTSDLLDLFLKQVEQFT